MEIPNNNLDIYYQINSSKDIKEDNLKNIKNNPYFIIELNNINRKKITFDFIVNSLMNDGVDLSKINEFKYLIEDKNDKNKIILESLNDENISEIKNLNKIYLHLLIVEEEQETPEADIINEEFDDYNIELEKCEKYFNEISMEIKKEEIYNQKILSDNLFKNIERNNFSNLMNGEYRNTMTMIKKTRKACMPLSNSFCGIKEENFNIIDNNNGCDNDNDFYSDNENDKENDLKLTKNKKKLYDNLVLRTRTSVEIKKNVKEEISLCYLYSNPLLCKGDNKKEYINNDCFNQIASIYNIFKESNIKANLKFEPINNNFNTYLESIPDILHINVNSSFDKNFSLHLEDYRGRLQYYKCEDLEKAISTDENGLTKIKLLILSTQNINEMKEIFKNIGIKNIIYIENVITYPDPNEQVEQFIKELYQNLIYKKKSVQESFENCRRKLNGQNIKVELFPIPKKEKDYIINPKDNYINSEDDYYLGYKSQKHLIFKDKIKDCIKLNRNCSLNLNFVKYNYKRIIGRNIELKNCIDKLYINNQVCVCGYPGAGKKSFIQQVGKFAFERNMYQEVHYIEIFYLRNADEALINKQKEIKEKMKIVDENQFGVLLIINLHYVIFDENDISTMEKLINNIKDRNFNYLFAFTINNHILLPKINKKLLRTPLIELGKLDITKRKNLFYSIIYNLKNKELIKMRGEKIITNSNGYPNDVYLITLFINNFCEEINNMDIDKINNDFIFNQLIEKYGIKIIKIFSIFAILKLGIREDILTMFFLKEEIDFIKKELKYIIFEEIDEKGKYYYLDDSYKGLIQKILKEKYYNEFLNSLILIIKNYSIVLRYLVNYSNYPYNICFEFHAGINKGFWLSVNESDYNEKFKKDYENFKDDKINNNIDIYFDRVQYFNNILNIFINSYYIEMMEKNLLLFKEYISQISICLPTILHFNNCFIYEKRICELFKERLGNLNLNKSRLRLKLYIHWLTGDPNMMPSECDLNANLIKDHNNKEIIDNQFNKNLKQEFDLIKIYDYIKKKHKENIDISGIYNDCQNIDKNNYFNLAKLNLLYELTLKNEDKKKYFHKANNYASSDNNIYMVILSLIMKAEYYLSLNEFDIFNDLIYKCEKEICENELQLQNTDINYKIDKAIKDKNDKYKLYTKNKLFFFTSNPFFDEEGNPLHTESNNSFYLKYKLAKELPKNLEMVFKTINQDFLKDLEKCLYNPIRFLYIGSDHFNEDGNLFYEKEFKTYKFDFKLLKEKIKKAKNKCEIVILGFLNSEEISEFFLSNKFPHVIYIKKSKDLNQFFTDFPYYYFYFQNCFYIFITKFLLNLSKSYLTIKESFIKANNAFKNEFIQLLNYIEKKEEKDRIRDIILSQILILAGDEKRENEIFFNDFEDVNNQTFSSKSLNLEKDDSNSNSNIQKNSANDKKEKKEKEDKFEYIHFPRGDLNDKLFEKLYKNRIYGMKGVLSNLINKILNYKFIVLYGDLFSGRTRICLELCKYFYMNDNFKEGIFYINFNKIPKLKKQNELKIFNKNNMKNKNNEINKALLIFDDCDTKKNSIYNYINKLNTYIIITIKNKEEFLDSWNKNNNKNNKNFKNIDVEDIFVNLDIPLEEKSAKELIIYLNILNNIKENKEENNLIYVKEVIPTIKNKIDEKKNKRKKAHNLTSSQI